MFRAEDVRPAGFPISKKRVQSLPQEPKNASEGAKLEVRDRVELSSEARSGATGSWGHESESAPINQRTLWNAVFGK